MAMDFIKNRKEKAQGAIEYLLLLAAAIVVVAIVISFMVTTIGPVQDQGNRELYNSICGDNAILSSDTNQLLCGCFLKKYNYCDTNSTGQLVCSSEATCPEALPEQYKTDALLIWDP